MRDVVGRLLTTRETAEVLGISSRSVFRLMDAGRLTPVRLSGSPRGRLMFEPDEVGRLIEHSREPRQVSA
jgi:excisionase family DNA binding protein